MISGSYAEAELRVAPSDSAKALSLAAEDEFPEVFATSRMIALMELAAARCMQPLLQAHELSVGVGVDIRHLGATPIGVRVVAKATFLERQGKLYLFKVEAFDDGGLIGEGRHSRAIVATERLLAGAHARNAR